MVKSLYRSFAALALAAAVLVPAAAHADKPDKGDKGDKHGRAVPEISGTHAGIALALVIGGAAIVVGRRRRKSS
jgi:hypothetical protein